MLAALIGLFTLHDAPAADWVSASDWTTGEDLRISLFDDAALIYPSIYAIGALGDSSVRDPGELQVGGHDPYRNGFSLQQIELGGRIDLGQGLGGKVIYSIYEDQENNSLDGTFEEAYGTLEVPGMGLKGGRYLNAFGFQNNVHLHAWNFVDLPLIYGRFLGDEGLQSDGGAVRIDIPSRWGANLAVSFGEAVAHDHNHGGEEEEEHEHGLDEGLLFDGGFVSGRLFLPWNQDDFNRWSSHLSVAVGNNETGKQTVVYGTGLAYEWLENGYEAGGARFRTALEIFGRSWTAGDVHDHDHGGEEHDDHDHGEEEHHDDHEGEHEEDAHDEEHHHDEEHAEPETRGTDFGFLASALYSPSWQWDLGGRVEYVSGDSEADLDERWRFSPVATWWANEDKSLSLRLQYNLDSLPTSEEHSIWLQLSLGWGSH